MNVDAQIFGTLPMKPRLHAMKFMTTLLVCCFSLHGLECAGAGPEELPQLQWANGDQLAGQLLSADDRFLEWKAPIFEQPFVIDLNTIQSLTFPVTEKQDKTDQPFRIFTRSGDVLNGDFVTISDGNITFKTERHGEIVLDRDEVRSFRRLNDPALIFDGPSGVEEWSTISRARSATDWKQLPQGGLTTQVVSAELYRDLALPALTEIEITLSWTAKPGFLLTFVEPNARRVPKHTVKLETWDDELVMQALASTGDFGPVLTLPGDQKRIQLRLLWNQLEKELSAYSRSGEIIAKLKADQGDGRKLTCLYLKNKGSDLTLESLRVRSWNGTALSALAEGRSHVHRLDGTFVYGDVQELVDRDMVIRDDSDETRVPLDDVSGVDFGLGEGNKSIPQALRASFIDGTTIGGQLQSINDGQLTLVTPYAAQPLTTNLNGIFFVEIKQDGVVTDSKPADVLEYRGARLQGQLAPVGSEGLLGWKPVGSTNASPLVSSDPARVIRKLDEDGPKKTYNGDMIYLRNGDVIPCRIETIDDQHVELNSIFAGHGKISRSEVKAIDFGSSGENALLQFDHPTWVLNNENEGAIEREGDRATFNESGTIGHENAFVGNTMTFDLTWTADEPVSLGVGVRSREANQLGSSSVRLYFIGDQIHVRGLERERGFVYRHRLTDRSARIEMSLQSNRFRMFINGDNALDQVLRSQREDGQGLVFATKRERPNKAPKELLTISNLRAGNVRRELGTVSIDENDKAQLLTIPRSRRTNPSKHVLVAQNGDVLRGQLVSITPDEIYFRSRFDEMTFARERVATVIWLDSPADDKAANVNADRVEPGVSLRHPMQAVLLGDITFSFSADQMNETEIIGKHPYLGDCRLPINEVSEIRIGAQQISAQSLPFSDWVLTRAPEPAFAANSGNPNAPQGFGVDSPLVGTRVANFQAKLNNGKVFQLSDHAGKVVVLDFWATWCGPCIRAMPEIMDAVAQFPKDQVTLIGVNQQETNQTVSDFLTAREWDLLVAFDPEGEISKRFRVEAIPQTVIIGPTGNIERLHIGAHNKLGEQLIRAIEQLIADEDSGDAGAED